MKLAVCVKQVPASDDVKIDEKTGTLRRSDVPGVMNPADYGALLMAVDLKRQLRECGIEASLTAVTMGPADASLVLREAMACGADDGILLCDRSFAGADTWATSLVLASAIEKEGGFSVIFTGKQSTDGETGHIGPQIAEHLGAAQLTCTEQIWWKDGLEAERVFDGIRERIAVELPAVLGTAAGAGKPFSLPIGAICDACERPIRVWNREDLGLDASETGLAGSRTWVRRTFLPEGGMKGVMLTGSVDEMAERLLDELENRHLVR